MAGVNQVFNLADDVARYVKACGKRSLLECKLLQGKINPKELKLASGTIGDTVHFSGKDFSLRIKELSKPGQESSTLKRLFSAEFKPQRCFDENGYMVTTVINKKTQKPVEIFIKEIAPNEYEFYKKTENIYTVIGKRKYKINKELGILEPGYMSNYCQDEFAGIGIRGHQLAVEKTMKENLKSIYLDSLSKAEHFHEKCLFRPLAKMKTTQDIIDDYCSSLSKDLAISPSKAKEMISLEKFGNNIFIDLKQTVININKICAKISPENVISHPTMGQYCLAAEELALWKDLVRSQPITL